jgi:RND family efflux transporter MFP subunit
MRFTLAQALTIALLLLCTRADTLAQERGDKGAGPPPAPVEVAPVVVDRVSERISLVGTTEAIAESIIAAEVSGLVERLPVSAGDLLKKGQLVAKLKSTNLALQLEAAEAAHKKAQANLAFAEKELARYTKLEQSKSIPGGKYDEVLYEEESWQQEVRRTQAEIDLIKDKIGKKTVPAAFSGFVAHKHTEIGEWLPVGGPVITLVDLRRIRLVVDVPERYAVQLSPRDEVMVTVPSLAEDPFPGHIYAVLPQGDPEARTIPVHVRLANPELRIRSGMEARVTFRLGDKTEALLVPKDAVLTAGGNTMVYVVAEGRARPIPVDVIGYQDGLAAVSGSLAPGDPVVIRGNERLRPGQSVEIIQRD